MEEEGDEVDAIPLMRQLAEQANAVDEGLDAIERGLARIMEEDGDQGTEEDGGSLDAELYGRPVGSSGGMIDETPHLR